jgi:predicted nucleotide-binding protein
MKVFISWSGELSRQVAAILRDWLPNVLQAVEPWLAGDEVSAGSRWSDVWAKQLSSSSAVLLCVTRGNIQSGWFNFEAGSASRAVDPGSLIPILIDLAPSDVTGPLAGFQSRVLDHRGVTQLVLDLNKRLNEPLDNQRLDQLIDIWLPILLTRLGEIQLPEPTADRLLRSDRDIVEEILEQIRDLTKQVGRLQLTSNEERTTPSVDADIQTSSEPSRPRVFIGSSTQGLSIAQAIQAGLDDAAECTVWNQGLFRPSQTNIESLVGVSAAFDFALIVMTADDVLIKKGNTSVAPRDNLIFELGLFTGSLWRAKTFLVKSRDEKLELPSDLDGVTREEYGRRADGNLIAALAPVCFRMKQVMGLG